MSAYAHGTRREDGRPRTVAIHREVYERHFGPIPPGMVVHHRDHDKRNNDPSNLVAMTHEEHSRHHNDRHPRVKACVVCGAQFEPAPTKRARKQTCSEECRRTLLSIKARARRG